MGKIKHISLIGIDKNTDLDKLQELQKKYPLAEFGVILSKNWAENGNRYFNPAELYKLRDRGLNLSAHLCGSVARSAIRNNFGPAMELCGKDFSLFKRAQLNIAKSDKNPSQLILDLPVSLEEVIIQQESAFKCDLFLSLFNTDLYKGDVSVLIDGSGGLGIETEMVPLNINVKVGYAGGLNPENILQKTKFLMESSEVNDFWVDMESGIRTDNWFDLEKAESVLRQVYSLISVNNK